MSIFLELHQYLCNKIETIEKEKEIKKTNLVKDYIGKPFVCRWCDKEGTIDEDVTVMDADIKIKRLVNHTFYHKDCYKKMMENYMEEDKYSDSWDDSYYAFSNCYEEDEEECDYDE